jgi:glutaminase
MSEAHSAGHELQILVDSLHSKYGPLADGALASYIPELSLANPDEFGICLVTTNGSVFAAGDCDRAFTIQSISKPFTFGMAIEECGHGRVFERVDVEPSGDAFNAIELQRLTNRPHNPMVNAGAITITALLYAQHGPRALPHLLDRFSAFAGRRLTIDDAVYQSERRTGHRNRAIAHLLLNFGMVPDEAEAALDLYFKQCSILVTCRDLAMMSATLANMGVNPLTGQQGLAMSCVKDVLSVMFTCGMYDYSGQWAYRVGMPAKSGVAGGMVAVVNRQLGIGTYSPRLDRYGNSVRGIEVCSELANRLGLHVFNCLNIGSSFLDTML